MSRTPCSIFIAFFLLFLFTLPSTYGGRSEIDSDFKFPMKKSVPYNTKIGEINKLSDDEISLALSELSLKDLHALNNMLTRRIPIDCPYPRKRQEDWKDNLKRFARETKKYNANPLVNIVKDTKSPEEKIHEELRQLRDNVEKKSNIKSFKHIVEMTTFLIVRVNLVRKKREDSGNDWKYTDYKYFLNSPNNEEYIKMLEGSFPNNGNYQAENEGSHIRVKRQ